MGQAGERGYLAVKNFAEFQHYKDRNPVWIKSYTRLLEDYDFLALSDAARSQLMLLWLVASRTDNRIPDDRRWIAHAIHATSSVKLDELKAAGFLIPVEQNASNVLAKSYQDATAPRARGEGEERRGETTPRPPRARSTADPTVRAKVPEAYREDFDRVALHVAVPESFYATLEAINAGETVPPPFTWEEIGMALRDLVANGKHERFNARQFRRYVEGVREMATKAPNGRSLSGRKLTIGEKVFLKASGGVT